MSSNLPLPRQRKPSSFANLFEANQQSSFLLKAAGGEAGEELRVQAERCFRSMAPTMLLAHDRAMLDTWLLAALEIMEGLVDRAAIAAREAGETSRIEAALASGDVRAVAEIPFVPLSVVLSSLVGACGVLGAADAVRQAKLPCSGETE